MRVLQGIHLAAPEPRVNGLCPQNVPAAPIRTSASLWPAQSPRHAKRGEINIALRAFIVRVALPDHDIDSRHGTLITYTMSSPVRPAGRLVTDDRSPAPKRRLNGGCS